ncbi:MAG: hypothetical protein AB1601_11105 [Planctomycetota bacterium]
MDATHIDSRVAALVAGDGLIEQRLAELDAKLSAWLELMRSGQTALAMTLRGRRAAGRAVPPADSAASSETSVAPVEPELDDEQLLASLDPETANAVRVRRRLSRDKRPIRELVAEIQAARRAEPTPTSARKRWWRRSDG